MKSLYNHLLSMVRGIVILHCSMCFSQPTSSNGLVGCFEPAVLPLGSGGSARDRDIRIYREGERTRTLICEGLTEFGTQWH